MPEVLQQLSLQRPLIITGPVVEKYGYLERVTAPLESSGIRYGVFAGVPSDPTNDTVEEALAELSLADYDCVVGLGGGSPMDTAKIVSVMGVRGGCVRDYAAPVDNRDAGLPVIAIPTTAGTGSEATRVTIITDTVSDEKLLCIGRAFMPTAALIDYEMTLTMPFRLTADTGIDSITHAMEAYKYSYGMPRPGKWPCPGGDDVGFHAGRHGIFQRLGSAGARNESADWR